MMFSFPSTSCMLGVGGSSLSPRDCILLNCYCVFNNYQRLIVSIVFERTIAAQKLRFAEVVYKLPLPSLLHPLQHQHPT